MLTNTKCSRTKQANSTSNQTHIPGVATTYRLTVYRYLDLPLMTVRNLGELYVPRPLQDLPTYVRHLHQAWTQLVLSTQSTS